MPFATTAAILGGTMAAGLGGAAIASHGAGKAADTQASAADYAANLQKEEADKALAFQQKQWDTQQANMEPWLKAGGGAIGTLARMLKTPGQGLLTPWTEQFQAPTDVTEQNDPGYQERLKIGQQMLENSAAAHGGLLSGNTAAAEQQFGQTYASNEYHNVYDRAMQQFQQKYGIFENNQTNTFNRLAALSGTGQTAATTLGQEGQAASSNMGNILLTTGAQQGQDAQNAAAARASGYVGGANAWSSVLGGGTNNLMNLLLMKKMFGGGGNGSVDLSGIDMSAGANTYNPNPNAF